jgi:SAM-dependent methyltransferase
MKETDRKRIDELQAEWHQRQLALGCTQRAVLFKRFPDWLNRRIHRNHCDFVIRHIASGSRTVLDVGCAFGRISDVIKARYPGIRFEGIELCEAFASAYEENYGPCFCGAVQDFPAHGREYDVIVVVTLLMYLNQGEHESVVRKLWTMLPDGGRLICIEPAIEILRLWRLATGKANASPTGDNVHHFDRNELRSLFSGIPGAEITDSACINLIPPFSATALHHAVAVTKKRA